MQINTSKKILLIILLTILPIVMSAQIGTRKYITRSGDTTIVVNAGSTGLSGEDAEFLFDKRASSEQLDKYSRYRKLVEAAEETEQVAKIVEVEKKVSNPSSGSLGFRIAQKNIRYLQNEQKASRAARDIIHRDATIEEMTFLKQKFGDKPSYFINGIHVEPKVAASLAEKDILTRSLKVANTTTGNPNGEIWYVVNSKVFGKLGLDSYDSRDTKSYATTPPSNITSPKAGVQRPQKVEQNILGEEVVTAPSSITQNEFSRLTPEQQQKLKAQQQEVEDLKRQIEEVRRQRAALSGSVEPTATATPRVAQPTPTEEVRYTAPRKQQQEEIVGFKDSPQERTRRERDEQDETSPKRSVRKIKERERNR